MKSKTIWIIVAVVVLILIIGYFTNWFGLSKPAKNTLPTNGTVNSGRLFQANVFDCRSIKYQDDLRNAWIDILNDQKKADELFNYYLQDPNYYSSYLTALNNLKSSWDYYNNLVSKCTPNAG